MVWAIIIARVASTEGQNRGCCAKQRDSEAERIGQGSGVEMFLTRLQWVLWWLVTSLGSQIIAYGGLARQG